MTELTMIAPAGEGSDPICGKAAFSYCCECGTYDAHANVCTCCGFDFRSEVAADEAE